MKIPASISNIGIALCFFVLLRGECWAIQLHQEPEGLYVHQMAHIFFIVSLAILVYRLGKTGLTSKKGWRFIKWSACLFILWNIEALLGHGIEGSKEFSMKGGEDIVDGTITIVFVNSLLEVFYYVLKLDHITCVPAICFLFVGLNNLIKGR